MLSHGNEVTSLPTSPTRAAGHEQLGSHGETGRCRAARCRCPLPSKSFVHGPRSALIVVTWAWQRGALCDRRLPARGRAVSVPGPLTAAHPRKSGGRE